MIEHLHLQNVGPAPEMSLEFGSRLNLITGDNGLGKSFLLDVIWWALTRKWPHDLNDRLTSGYPARPTDPKKPATIGFGLTSKSGRVSYKSTYVPRDEAWSGKAGRPWNPGLVVYAHSDGGFSVWDPARNYWKKKGNIDVQERLPGYVFSAQEVWDGLEVEVDGKLTIVCNGLLRDWASWVREKGFVADMMSQLLSHLAPAGESLAAGPLVRLSVNDARAIPSIRTPYSSAVPILHASSGIRRAVGLAYMLIWSWNEHVLAADLLGEKPTNQVVVLFDEIESHLHPRWQRSILRAVLEAAGVLHDGATIQLVAATHSPLIMAAAEPLFDPETDAWFDLDLESEKVVLQKRRFVRRGDVSAWLTSEAFDLKEPRSLEAEEAIREALKLAKKPSPAEAKVRRVHKLLQASLGDTDRFWLRWSEFERSHRRARPGARK
jgi:predicted ATPase